MILQQVSDEELRHLYFEEKMSGKQIAALYNVSPSAVCLRMKQSKIQARRAHEYPHTDKQVAAWRKNGEALAELARTPERRKMYAEYGKKTIGRRKRDYEFGGHEKRRSDGYIKVYSPDHPHSSKDGYVMKHILVMERIIGRHLEKEEVVHHINHVKDDNRPENLQLMTNSEHMALHMKERHANRRK